MKEFHGYVNGNLNWEAAFEAESGTEVICLRTWKDEDITPEVAVERMKGNIMSAILVSSPALQTAKHYLNYGTLFEMVKRGVYRADGHQNKKPILGVH